jgi:hypothetical protein
MILMSILAESVRMEGKKPARAGDNAKRNIR